MKLVIAILLSFASVAHGADKMLVSSGAFPYQKQVIEIQMRSADAELRVLELNKKLIQEIDKKIGRKCARGNDDACLTATDTMLSVFDRTTEYFQSIRHEAIAASNLVSANAKLPTLADRRAFSTVVTIVNTTWTANINNTTDGNYDAARALVIGAVKLQERVDGGVATTMKTAYTLTRDICLARLEEIRKDVQTDSDNYARLLKDGMQLSSKNTEVAMK